MMRSFIGIFLFFTVSIYPQLIDSVKVSIFLSTNLNNSTVLSSSENNATYKSDPTFGAGFEIDVINNGRSNNGGIGIEFQSNNWILGVPGNFNCTPIYAFYDISLGEDISQYIPKLSLKLGYNILSATDDFVDGTSSDNQSYIDNKLKQTSNTSNGIFYALGISTQLNKSFLLRILYSVNQGKVNIAERDYLLNNEKISINLVLNIL